MARITLQRHTHPDIGEGICYGWSDMDVREEYLSIDLPEVMRRYHSTIDIQNISQLYSSPLQRCSRLALDIKSLTSAREVVYDDRLKELNFGEWELRAWDDIFRMEGSQAWFDDYINVATPQGESFIGLLHRAESFLEDLKSQGEDALIVTHSGVMRALMVATQQCRLESVFDVDIKYGGVIEIEI